MSRNNLGIALASVNERKVIGHAADGRTAGAANGWMNSRLRH